MQSPNVDGSEPKTKLVGRHQHLTTFFELLAENLGPFIDVRMQNYFTGEASWLDAASTRLGRPVEHGHTDPFFQLLVLRRFWGPVFASSYSNDLRPLIDALLEARNYWAHFNLPDNPQTLDNYILAGERLVGPASPEGAVAMRRLRTTLKQQTDAVKNDTTPEPTQQEVDRLTNQLCDSERLFNELQSKHTSIQSTLADTQQDAMKHRDQLRSIEQELLTIYGRSDALELRLATEKSSRDRIEWLFVGLIAVLLVVLVLL